MRQRRTQQVGKQKRRTRDADAAGITFVVKRNRSGKLQLVAGQSSIGVQVSLGFPGAGNDLVNNPQQRIRRSGCYHRSIANFRAGLNKQIEGIVVNSQRAHFGAIPPL